MAALGRIEVNDELTRQHTQWSVQFGDMHRFLMRSFEAKNFAAQGADAIRTQWLHDYIKLSHKLPSSKDWSRADILFILCCYSLCCAKPEIRNRAILTDASEISAKLCLLGCRHTPETRKQSLTHESTKDLLEWTASWVVQFSSHPEQLLLEALTKFPPKLTRATTKAIHVVLEMPHLLAMQTDADRDAIRDMALREAEKVAKPDLFKPPSVDEELNELAQEEQDLEESSQRGDFWLTEVPMIVSGIVPLASRIWHQVLLEQEILSRFPRATQQQAEVYNYPPIAIERLKKLVIERCNTSSADSFGPKFRRFIFQRYLPVGATLLRHRSVQTESQEIGMDQLLEMELGMSVTQALYNLISSKPIDIAQNPEHELHELLLVYTFQYLMEHECGVDYMKSFVISAPELTARHGELLLTHQHHKLRRPRAVELENRWFLHDQGLMYDCKGELDSQLRFLMMMRKAVTSKNTLAYNNCHGKGNRTIKRFSDMILAEDVHIDLWSWAEAK